MEYKKQLLGGYNLHTIKTDKFKLCHVEIIFRNNVEKEDITKRNILFDLLCEGSKDYSTKRKLNLQLEDLYNAQIYAITSKVGNSMISNLCMDFISPTFTESAITNEALKTLFSLVFNPLVVNREFDNKSLNLVKKRLKDEIKSIKENPKRLAILEAFKSLGNTPTSFSAIGFLEDIDEITPENLYDYYEKVLKSDYVDIYVIGNLDMDEVTKVVKESANFKVIKNHPVEMYVDNPKIKEKYISNSCRYAQSNIVILLQLNNLNSYEKKFVANIYNMILGGGSLQTKLYKRLRNENSLCYNVNSSYQKYDGFILITTAVDVNATSKAIKLIKQSIKDMTNNITEEELNEAKETIITSLNMNKDNIGRIVDNYFYQDISDLDDIETRIKTFKNVTINDLYELSKKISISTIYNLDGGAHE